ncbi:hypothetical protein L6164_007513 [Bauhinia variegata]|uniref:Uncharacterized protein n=1 Tax=Bauhinia variegata TaxID=167791 RepID=A0ACB9PCW2_BAUVA|nr:hypothetical protein L6164_007513 [Bauhinia variegata]
MGCINSKNAVSKASPPYLPSARITDHGSVIAEPASRTQSVVHYDNKGDVNSEDRSRDGKRSTSKKESSKSSTNGSLSFRLGLSHRFVEAEQNAAGWPPWLTASAGEAIHGWIPLKADCYEKLDKIGQGTYSSVYQAREVETGRMVALKKVRFDNFQPESIRFMAREIAILRMLDHPNIMKLEGLITSRISSSLYLVFEYMEHDLAGLVSCPDAKFTESQVKCYMRQLLSGIEHCHVRGVMHRDIKASNILVNNEGTLKIGDFGLANIVSPANRQQLTSRVVTLWYRPPELLMGSMSYDVSVDLWSVGCVFAELFLGKPLLKGRTEVEQLHKIFKLCGSPPDEFWKKSKLPHVSMFKPQTHYTSCLRERCKEFPDTAVNLIETLLAIDSSKRGTASSALMTEYFRTKPYACDPSTLPKYPPNKEMDAKHREEARRKKTGGKLYDPTMSRRQRRGCKILQEPNNGTKPPTEEEGDNNSQTTHKDDGKVNPGKGKGGAMNRGQMKPTSDAATWEPCTANMPNGYSVLTGPVAVSGSSGFAWAKRRKPDTSSTLSDGSRSKISALDPSFAKGTYDLTNLHVSERKYSDDPADITMDYDPTEQYTQGVNKQAEHVELSGRMLSRQNKVDDLLLKNENSIRRAARKSRLGRD